MSSLTQGLQGHIGIALQGLAHLWQESGDAGLLTAISSILGIAVHEVEALLRKRIEDKAEQSGGIFPPKILHDGSFNWRSGNPGDPLCWPD